MIFRLSAKLGKKLKYMPTETLPIHPNPYTDWSAHLFTADRTQYILISNTTSLYSRVLYGKGIVDDGEFLSRAISAIGELMDGDGFSLIRERVFLPETSKIAFSKALNRSVIGSMNELIYFAKAVLVEEEISPYDLSFRLNQIILSSIGNDVPRDAFPKMELGRKSFRRI